MAQEPHESVRMNFVTLCALIGGVVAFVVTGALLDLLLVAFGAAVGAGVGWAIQRFARDVRTFGDATERSRRRRAA